MNKGFLTPLWLPSRSPSTPTQGRLKVPAAREVTRGAMCQQAPNVFSRMKLLKENYTRRGNKIQLARGRQQPWGWLRLLVPIPKRRPSVLSCPHECHHIPCNKHFTSTCGYCCDCARSVVCGPMYCCKLNWVINYYIPILLLHFHICLLNTPTLFYIKFILFGCNFAFNKDDKSPRFCGFPRF